MSGQKVFPNMPLHGYSHLEEVDNGSHWFEDEDFPNIVMLSDLLRLDSFRLIYGEEDCYPVFELSRALYPGNYILRVTSGEADDDCVDCLRLNVDHVGFSTERPFGVDDSRKERLSTIGYIMEDAILMQESKHMLFDLPLSMRMTPWLNNKRERLSSVLGALL
jgi:hypothetical protein